MNNFTMKLSNRAFKMRKKNHTNIFKQIYGKNKNHKKIIKQQCKRVKMIKSWLYVFINTCNIINLLQNDGYDKSSEQQSTESGALN